MSMSLESFAFASDTFTTTRGIPDQVYQGW